MPRHAQARVPYCAFDDLVDYLGSLAASGALPPTLSPSDWISDSQTSSRLGRALITLHLADADLRPRPELAQLLGTPGDVAGALGRHVVETLPWILECADEQEFSRRVREDGNLGRGTAEKAEAFLTSAVVNGGRVLPFPTNRRGALGKVPKPRRAKSNAKITLMSGQSAGAEARRQEYFEFLLNQAQAREATSQDSSRFLSRIDRLMELDARGH